MTSPAVATSDGRLYGLTSLNKCVGVYESDGIIVRLERFPEREWSSDAERWDWIARWALRSAGTVDRVFIENYALAARNGRVFHIGELTGVLKDRLWCRGVEVVTVTPGQVKKAATGRGNAKKPEMIEAFGARTGIDLPSLLSLTKKQLSPASDLADAFWTLEAGRLLHV